MATRSDDLHSHSCHVRCVKISNCMRWILIIQPFPAVAAVRVYALWNRDLRLFALVMVTGVLPALANLVSTLVLLCRTPVRVMLSSTSGVPLPCTSSLPTSFHAKLHQPPCLQVHTHHVRCP